MGSNRGSYTCFVENSPFTLRKNYFSHHNFDYTLSDIIHSPHSRHLVGGFELFGYAFLFGEFFYQPEKKSLCLFFGIGEMGMEFAGSE